MTQKDVIIFEKAAEMLNVSTEFLDGALQNGDIVYQQKGSDRYIKLNDLEEYGKKLDAQRHAAVQKVTARAVKAGLYKNRKPRVK